MLERRDQPSLSKFILGTAAGILLTICIGVSMASGALVSIPLRIILFLPDQLGLVWRATPENTLKFFGDGAYRLPQLPKGSYLIYMDRYPPTAHFELMREADAEPVILTEFTHDILTMDRGPGEVNIPVYRFHIGETGNHLLRVNGNGPRGFRITQDFGAHNDFVLFAALIIEPAILGLIILGIYRRRNRDRLASEKAHKGAEREKFNEWIEKYRDGRDS